jgi:ABC-type multidrug transport system ATPase subunit
MILAERVSKSYGRRPVLRDVSFSVHPGDRVALVGLNGAGKTTLMRCLLGLTAFGGTLTIEGHDVARAGRQARARVGYVPQRAPHFDGTLADLVTFFARLRDMPQERVIARLSALGLDAELHGDVAIRSLSGGMLQKALLALALAADAPLLLLDEPTANLDARARREFLRALDEMADDRTILLASHRLADLEAVAQRILVLHDGRVAFDGSVAALTAVGLTREAGAMEGLVEELLDGAAGRIASEGIGG